MSSETGGYDALSNHEAVVKHGAIPIIHIRHAGTGGFPDEGIRTKRGIPSCDGWQTMEYVRTDPETRNHLFRCPAEGCHLRAAAGRRRKEEDKKCGVELWLDPMDDLRELGFILRGSNEWVGHYNKRTTIERTFRSVKHSRNLDEHRHLSMVKVELHATLSLLTYQATMLARVKAGDVDNLRQMRVKVGQSCRFTETLIH